MGASDWYRETSSHYILKVRSECRRRGERSYHEPKNLRCREVLAINTQTHWRGCCSFLVEMKKFALVLLVVAAVGYYFGIDPTDFLPTVPQSDAALERVRHAPAAPEQ